MNVWQMRDGLGKLLAATILLNAFLVAVIFFQIGMWLVFIAEVLTIFIILSNELNNGLVRT